VYQVNATVPSVPTYLSVHGCVVSLSLGNIKSNTVTMAVQ
jgi:hypothetical protein